jgi:3-hydroxybutyryl-CoA dehydrogenase
MSIRVGVAGAGVMGRGIAELAVLHGCDTIVFDPLADLPWAEARIAEDLDKGVARGRWTAADAAGARPRLVLTPNIEDLADAELVIEAIVEQVDTKRELFARLEDTVAADCVLATNTSSIPVGAIAEGLRLPQRVIGMHFFNPPPLMPLVEIIAGPQSHASSVQYAHRLAATLARTAIDAADLPGFVVNRCNRPFGLEALEIVASHLASPATVDRIVRQGGGFPMGPFEFQDLVGLDVSADVGRTLFEMSGGEPRWKPSPLLERRVKDGRLGRKTGSGWYDYPPGPPPDPGLIKRDALDPKPSFVVTGQSTLADEFRTLARNAGWSLAGGSRQPEVVIDLEPWHSSVDLEGTVIHLVLVAGRSFLDLARPGSIGFHALPPLHRGGLVELTLGSEIDEALQSVAEAFLSDLGLDAVTVGDAPGLVLGRVVAQLVNEAAFALEQGVASAADIDAAMTLGVRHPHGPIAWGDQIGLGHLVAILDGLREITGDDRYRASSLLRTSAAEGRRLAGA